MSEIDLSEKLDVVIELLALDKKEHIDSLLNKLDEIDKKILAKTSDWTAPSEYKGEIAKAAGVTPRTILNRSQDLEEKGYLESKGSGPAKKYKRNPLFSYVRRLKNKVGEDA